MGQNYWVYPGPRRLYTHDHNFDHFTWSHRYDIITCIWFAAFHHTIYTVIWGINQFHTHVFPRVIESQRATYIWNRRTYMNITTMPLHRKIFSTSFTESIHWNGNVIKLTKFLLWKGVMMTTFSVAIMIKMWSKRRHFNVSKINVVPRTCFFRSCGHIIYPWRHAIVHDIFHVVLYLIWTKNSTSHNVWTICVHRTMAV